MDAEIAARRWADVLRSVWPTRDVDAFLELYTADATFRSALGATENAREHMRGSLLLGEGTPEVWVGEPLVHADRAAVEWWAAVQVEGEPTTFAGTAWLRFDGEGRVREEQDYWVAKPGRGGRPGGVACRPNAACCGKRTPSPPATASRSTCRRWRRPPISPPPTSAVSSVAP